MAKAGLVFYIVKEQTDNAVCYATEVQRQCISAGRNVHGPQATLNDLETAHRAATNMVREIKAAKAIVKRAIKAS